MNERRSLITVGSNTLRLQIEEMHISQLKRNTRSPRIHPDKQIVMLARNIDAFGFLLPCTSRVSSLPVARRPGSSSQ